MRATNYRASYEVSRLEDAPEKEVAENLTRALLYEFDALHERYLSFWPTTTHEDEIMRNLRPDWPYFSDRDFEHLIRAALFLAQEQMYRLTPATRDGGFDLVRREEMVFGKGQTATYMQIVQCKLRRDGVPLADVRDFVGTVYTHNARGVLVSNAPLSRGGRKFLALSNEGLRGVVVGSVCGDTFRQFLEVCEATRSGWTDLLDAVSEEESNAAKARIDAGKEQARRLIGGAAL